MQSRRLFVLHALVLAVGCASIEAGAVTAAPFAVKATNVTMPSVTAIKTSAGITSVHLGSSQITVTGIPGAGNLSIGCQYSGPATKAKIPRQCGFGRAAGSSGECRRNVHRHCLLCPPTTRGRFPACLLCGALQQFHSIWPSLPLRWQARGCLALPSGAKHAAGSHSPSLPRAL